MHPIIQKLPVRLKQPLPGPLAHEPMRAIPIGSVIPNFTHKIPPKPGSVLILLWEEDGEVFFPLTKRQVYTGAHSGQVSLPGGKAEQGEDSIQTALREGEEEIGVAGNSMKVLGTLSPFFVIPSNFIVVPVVAIVSAIPFFRPDSYEVARILKGNVSDLVRQDAVQVKEIVAAGQYNMRAPHFEIEGEVVWGATAMILNEFRVVWQELAKDE
jgi:8-oxo-dGTP pyrophosphatase MutT (NUDIX family)